MPPTNTATLSSRLDQLIQQRQQHVEAADQLTATIEQIASLLGTSLGGNRRGRPPGHRASTRWADARRPRRRRDPRPPPRPGRARRLKSAAMNQSSTSSAPTRTPPPRTSRNTGPAKRRGGTADNALSKLVREKKIKRFPLDGQHGSRFAV